jgi:two-component system response regulator HydG
MPRHPHTPELDTTRADTANPLAAAAPLSVLIAIGDAQGLGRSRIVLPVPGALEIGRRPEGDPGHIWQLEDDRVSRRHAVVRADPRKGAAEILDLGSRNGTVVDGRPIGTVPTPLRPGAIIFIGTHAAVFRFVSAADLEAIERDQAEPFTPVATASPELARKFQVLRHLSRGSEDLLIVGETGVGKEELARGIHKASGRTGRFVAINCPALPGTLIESELFGYAKGAHSQATKDKPGLIEEAEGGTLFLDEFAEISQEMQAKLLRFLEGRAYMPLGATKPRHAEVRVLAATNRELSALRQDIIARLGPEPVSLPPLRNHPEDIAALASHFLRDRPEMAMESTAFQALCLHDWPDNVRGLKKVLTRAADLASAEERKLIASTDLPEGIGVSRKKRLTASVHLPMDSAPSEPARRSPRAALDKAELEALLERHDWVVARAAREIDRDHAVLWRWIKRYGLDASRARPDPDRE